MLRILDKSGHTRFIHKDEDDEPTSIDELVLNDQHVEPTSNNEEQEGEEDAS